MQVAAAAVGGAAAAALVMRYLTGQREARSNAAKDYGSMDMMNAAAVEEAPSAAPSADDASVTFPLPRSVYRQLGMDIDAIDFETIHNRWPSGVKKVWIQVTAAF